MPIIITMAWGERIQLPESWDEVLNKVSRLGTLELKGDDGHKTIFVKSHIGKVDEWTEESWAKFLEIHKKNQEEQQKVQARQRAQAQVEAWHKQPWWKKAFRKCPITLPADLRTEGDKS